MSKIEWTDKTWNIVTGCTKISPGCKNCYAERMTRRLKAMGQKKYAAGFDKVVCHPEVLHDPFNWCKPSKIFVCSMSDLFHKDVPFTFILEAIQVMAAAGANGHVFQILTKRPDIALDFFEWFGDELPSNVWFGTTVENQANDWRIHDLLKIPAKIRFLSIEPMLGLINLDQVWLESDGDTLVDWVIVGGESGPGARPMHPDWPRKIRDQCETAGIPFMFKQWGEWAWSPFDKNQKQPLRICRAGVVEPLEFTKKTLPKRSFHMFGVECVIKRIGKKKAGRLLDGKEYMQFPLG